MNECRGVEETRLSSPVLAQKVVHLMQSHGPHFRLSVSALAGGLNLRKSD